jgi:hypothetical protein
VDHKHVPVDEVLGDQRVSEPRAAGQNQVSASVAAVAATSAVVVDHREIRCQKLRESAVARPVDGSAGDEHDGCSSPSRTNAIVMPSFDVVVSMSSSRWT